MPALGCQITTCQDYESLWSAHGSTYLFTSSSTNPLRQYKIWQDWTQLFRERRVNVSIQVLEFGLEIYIDTPMHNTLSCDTVNTLLQTQRGCLSNSTEGTKAASRPFSDSATGSCIVDRVVSNETFSSWRGTPADERRSTTLGSTSS